MQNRWSSKVVTTKLFKNGLEDCRVSFKIIYNIVDLWLHRRSVNFNISTILVHMNGKGYLTGYGLHGYKSCFLNLTGQSNTTPGKSTSVH